MMDESKIREWLDRPRTALEQLEADAREGIPILAESWQRTNRKTTIAVLQKILGEHNS